MKQEPPGGLDTERNKDQEEDAGDDLLSGGNEPTDRTGFRGVSLCDGRSPHCTDMHKDLDRAGEEASDLRRGELCLVGGDDVFDHTDSQVGKHPTDAVLLPLFGGQFD